MIIKFFCHINNSFFSSNSINSYVILCKYSITHVGFIDTGVKIIKSIHISFFKLVNTVEHKTKCMYMMCTNSKVTEKHDYCDMLKRTSITFFYKIDSYR